MHRWHNSSAIAKASSFAKNYKKTKKRPKPLKPKKLQDLITTTDNFFVSTSITFLIKFLCKDYFLTFLKQ